MNSNRPGIVGPIRSVSTNMLPVDAHVSHLRHLCRQKTAELILRERHRIPGNDAKETARNVSLYVSQALEFYDAANSSRPQVRPVLQYYAYLNLAVAVILCYRPNGYQGYFHHGLQDRTSRRERLELSTKIVRATKGGAIPLFHSILSDIPLTTYSFRLKELVVSIPMLELELEDAFHIRPCIVPVEESVAKSDTQPDRLNSTVVFSTAHEDGPMRITQKKLETWLPSLRSQYTVHRRQHRRLTYYSINSWPVKEHKNATSWHRQHCLKLINFGGHSSHAGGVEYRWRNYQRVALMPTLSAALALSFYFSSLARYRPSLMNDLRRSQVNLLVDVFVNEADGLMIPAMRNLLYAEQLSTRFGRAG